MKLRPTFFFRIHFAHICVLVCPSESIILCVVIIPMPCCYACCTSITFSTVVSKYIQRENKNTFSWYF